MYAVLEMHSHLDGPRNFFLYHIMFLWTKWGKIKHSRMQHSLEFQVAFNVKVFAGSTTHFIRFSFGLAFANFYRSAVCWQGIFFLQSFNFYLYFLQKCLANCQTLWSLKTLYFACFFLSYLMWLKNDWVHILVRFFFFASCIFLFYCKL
jgi:hypothetical protein